MAKHKEVYRGDDCVLLCGGKIIASSPCGYGVNFMIDSCPECGMEIYTTGFSPETDKVLEYKKNR